MTGVKKNIRVLTAFLAVAWALIPGPAAALDTLINDGFEAPGNLGSWTVSNVVINNKAQNVFTGTQAAEFTDAAAPGASLTDSLNLSEYQGSDSLYLHFFWQDASKWENTDSFLVEIDSGWAGTWKQVYAATGENDVYARYSVNLAAESFLGSAYGLRFRFYWDGSSTQEGAFLDSVLLVGAKAQAPSLTGLSGSVNIAAAQKTDGTDSVIISFEVSDKEKDSVYVTAEYRQGAGGWSAIPEAYLQGDYGWVNANNSTADRRIAWDVPGHLGALEAADYQVRLTADDMSGGVYDSTTTAMALPDLLIDTRAPENLAGFAAVDSAKDSIKVTWTQATDGNFDHYEVWYGTVRNDVATRSGGAVEWDDTDDAGLVSVTAESTVITGLSASTKYYLQIWAADSLGNDTSSTLDSISTAATSAPVVTGWDPFMPVVAAQSDSDTVVIGYEVSDLDDPAVTVSAEYKFAGGPWIALNTEITGDTGSIATSPSADRTILWDVKTAFGADVDTLALVRVAALDATDGDTTESDTFVIDTRAPVWTGVFACAGSTASSITLSWTPVAESNFDHYKVWYDTLLSTVLARSVADEWNGANDPAMNVQQTSGTVVKGLLPERKYYFKIWAHDSLGYQSTTGADSMFTQPLSLPFTDGFEAPAGVGNWTASNVAASAAAAFQGTQCAAFTATTPDAYLVRTFDLSPYQGAVDAELYFAWNENSNWEPEDSFFVDVRREGSSWQRVYRHGDDVDVWTEVTVDLDAAGDLTSAYEIRFQYGWDGVNAVEAVYLDSVRVSASTPSAPTLTGLAAAAYIGAVQATDGGDSVNITFEAADADRDSVFISAEYRVGAGGWVAIPTAYLTGDYGRISGNDAAADRRIRWDVLAHLGAVEAANYQVRLTADDEYGGPFDSTVTAMQYADLVVDTRAPRSLASFAAVDSAKDSITVAWSAATDANFGHYEVWYGTAKSDVETRSGGAVEWDDTDDANLASVATETTYVTGLNPGTKYYLKIWAADSLGNDTTTALDSITTVPTSAPVVTGWDPQVQVYAAQVDSGSVMIGYEVSDLDDPAVTVTAEYKLAGGPWTALTTNIIGDTGTITSSDTENDTILWDIKTAFGADVDTQALVRIMAEDATSADTTLSDTFIIDTRPPAWTGGLACAGSTASSITLNWTAVTESNFDHYKVWYDTVLANVVNRSGADEWNGANDPAMNLRATASTVVTGLHFDRKYYFKIWAHDSLGYQSTVAADSMRTQSGDLPFTDGFEAPTGVGNWTALSVTASGAAAYQGAQCAEFGAVTPNASLVRSFDLSPYQGTTDMSLFFAWTENSNWEPEDSFFVDVRRNGGSWQRVYRHGDDMDAWTEVTVDLDSVGDLTAAYEIRFLYGWDGVNAVEAVYLDSVRVTGSIPSAPTLTGLDAAPYISAVQVADGGDSVNISFEAADADRDSVFITAEYRIGAGAWTAIPTAYLAGDYGRISGNDAAADRRIRWDVLSHLGAVEVSNGQVRLTADDEYGGPFDSTVVAMQYEDLVLDTKAPRTLGSFAAADSAKDSITVAWTAATDANFGHYEVWYGTAKNDVETRSGGALEWDDVDDANLTAAATETTYVTGLNPGTKYYLKIWAADSLGNDTTTALDSISTAQTPAPVVTGWDPFLPVYAAQTDSDSVVIGYEVSDLDDPTVTVTAEYKLSGGPWLALDTDITGDTGSIATSPTTDRMIRWNVVASLGAEVDTQALVRVMALDETGGDTTLSDTFIIDRRMPVWTGGFACAGSTASTVTLSWTPVTESNFDHYKVWYGTSLSAVQNRTSASWNGANDPAMNTLSTGGTVITGLSFDTKYYFKIWAHDSLGYESTVAADSIRTQSGDLPFTDNFEAPGNLGNWAASGVAVDAAASYQGTQSAFFSPVTPDPYLVRTFDLSPYQGASDVNLFFAWQDKHTYEVLDSFCVDVNRNGAGWERVYGFGGNQDVFAEVNVDLDAAGPLTSNYQVRFRFAWDGNGTQEGAYLDSVRLTGSIPSVPTLTGLAAAANISAAQTTDGGDSVNITFEAADADRDSVFITADYRIGTGTWNAIPTAYLTGDEERIDGNDAAADRRIRWDVLSHLGAVEASNYQVRLTANDEGGGAFDSTVTAMAAANLVLDTRAPQNLTALVKADSGWNETFFTGSIKLAWTGVTDANFDHYEIWYGTSASDVGTRSGTAVEWDDTDQPGLATAATDTAWLTDLAFFSTYYFKIWAVDTYGNEDTVAAASYFVDIVLEPQDIVNDMTLTVRALSDTSVELSWNPGIIEEAEAESCGIWYKTGDYPDSAHDPTSTRLAGYAMTDSVDTLYGLSGGTEYFFALLCKSTSTGWCDTSSSASDTAAPYGAAAVTVTATDLTPTLTAGDTVPVVSLAFSGLSGTPRFDMIPVFRTGTALASDVPRMLLYLDADKDNVPDSPGSPLAIAPFITDTTEFTGLSGLIPSTGANWLIAFDIASDAVITRSAGVRMNANAMVGTNWTTPAFAGITTGIYSLPVELSAFTASYVDGVVRLYWRTESEKDNARWNVLRRREGEQAYTVVHSFRKNSREYTTAFASDYTWDDDDVEPGAAYYYMLEDVALDGRTEQHGPVYVRAATEQPAPELAVYPSVFRSGVTFRLSGSAIGAMTLHVRTPDGRVIGGVEGAGAAELRWDGTDLRGRPVPGGMYLYELTTETADRTVRYRGKLIRDNR